MAVRYNTAEGAPTGAELAVGDTGSTSGDAFTSITKTGTGPSLQATATSPVEGSKSYLLVTGTAADGHVTVGWNEGVAVTTGGGIMLSGAFAAISGAITLMAIRGSAGQMAELQIASTGVVTVVDVNRAAVITTASGTIPTNGTQFAIRLDVDPGTTTTDGKARLWVWVAGAKTVDTEVTGKNLFRSGGITARRWGGLDVTATTGFATLRVDELHTIDTYASGAATATGMLSLTGSADVASGVAATGTGVITLTGSARAARDYDIVVLVGQSNMRGAAQDYDANGTDAYPATVDEITWSGNTLGGLSHAVEPLPTRDAGTGMGAGNTFAKRWANEKGTGRRVLIINAARGGTGFSLPSTGDDTAAIWDVDATNDSHNLAWTTISAVQDAITRFPGSAVVAILANHGSTDGTNNLSRATMKARLERWIDTLRSQLGIPTVPYLMMQMRPDLISGQSNMKVIDDAQIDVTTERAHTAHGTSPNDSGSWVSGSSVHFNAVGDRTIGSGLYDLVTTSDANGAATATATLSLTGSATAGAGASATGTGAITLTGTATARGAASAAATFTLTATATARGAATATGGLVLTGQASTTGAASATGVAVLVLTGAATAQGAATATGIISLTGSAVTISGWRNIIVTATIGAPRHAGTIAARTKTGTIDAPRWAGRIEP